MRAPLLRTTLVLLGWVAIAPGCVWDLEHDSSQSVDPTGPVARSANDAWPGAPADVASVTAAQILEACAVAGGCSSEVMTLDLATRLSLVDLCVFDAVFSAERAVPMSGLGHSNERVEYWVQCVLSHADQCDAVDACRTERDPSIVCEEGGCRTTIEWQVSCAGSVATLQAAGASWQRDCARSFATCDAASPTGCTDRLPTACPPDAPLENRCDGHVRLGCDRALQVSYHDCERLGGRCADPAAAPARCAYDTPPDLACGPEAATAARCEGSLLVACVNGSRVELPTELCPPLPSPAE